MLTSVLSLSAFALYSLAYTIASAVRMLAQPIDQAVFPRLTQLHHVGDSAGLATLYHKATQYTIGVDGECWSISVSSSAVTSSRSGCATLRSPARPTRCSQLCVIGMVLNGIMNGPYFMQMAAGWTELLVKVNAVMVVLFLPLIVILTLQAGIVGAAVAWVLLNIAYLVSVVRLMHRRLLIGEMRDWYVKDLLLPISAGAAAALLYRAVVPTPTAALPMLVFLGAALVSILVASCLAADRVRHEVEEPAQGRPSRTSS